MIIFKANVFVLLTLTITACAQTAEKKQVKSQMTTEQNNKLETAVFAAGCFWCVEGIFQLIDGVALVESGYCGGITPNPTYKEVCTGTTGHAEVARITYNSSKVSFETLLSIFWQTHDPTTLNRQGNDFGTQYRSAIFYINEEQKTLAEKYKKELDSSAAFSNPITTEITKLDKFYKAEDYHQNYYKQNSGESYCTFVIAPKIEKFRKIFKDKLKLKGEN